MDILKVLKQVALSVLARRKKWVLIAFCAALGLFVPVAYRMSQEPPRFRTSATILMETRPEGIAALPGVLALPASRRPARHPEEPGPLGGGGRVPAPELGGGSGPEPLHRRLPEHDAELGAPPARRGDRGGEPAAPGPQRAPVVARSSSSPRGHHRHRGGLRGGLPAAGGHGHREHLRGGARLAHAVLQRGRHQDQPRVPRAAADAGREAAQHRRGVAAAVHQCPRRRASSRPPQRGGQPAHPDGEHATPRSSPTRT